MSKGDTTKSHAHSLGGNGAWVDAPGTFTVNASGSIVNMTQVVITGSTGTAETAPMHVRVPVAVLV